MCVVSPGDQQIAIGLSTSIAVGGGRAAYVEDSKLVLCDSSNAAQNALFNVLLRTLRERACVGSLVRLLISAFDAWMFVCMSYSLFRLQVVFNGDNVVSC